MGFICLFIVIIAWIADAIKMQSVMLGVEIIVHKEGISIIHLQLV